MREISRFELYSFIKDLLTKRENTNDNFFLDDYIEQLEKIDGILNLLDFNTLLLKGIESSFLTDSTRESEISKEDFFEIYHNNLNAVRDSGGITYYLNTRLEDFKIENFNRRNTYYCFNSLLNEINKINNKALGDISSILGEYFQEKNKLNLQGLNKVFLSYAFDDLLYSICLHAFMLKEGIFLYVDGIFSPKLKDGKLIKERISKELETSKQLLFLRTVNSEFNIRGSGNIRGWCSWELGTYYACNTSNHNNKFYIELYGGRNENITNYQMDGIQPLRSIKSGVIS